MLLTSVRQRQREGRIPKRPITLCFTADEEAGGHRGAEVLINEHPEEFEGVTDAVGEVGGFSTTVRGPADLPHRGGREGHGLDEAHRPGRAGHGSMINDDNAVARLSAAVARLGAHQWPIRLTPTMEVLLGTVAELAGTEVTPDNARALVEEFGGASRMLGAVISNTVNPTMLSAGYKVNVIPTEATAHVDARSLPGYEDEFFEVLVAGGDVLLLHDAQPTGVELHGDDLRLQAGPLEGAHDVPLDGHRASAPTAAVGRPRPGPRPRPWRTPCTPPARAAGPPA